jgi:hypothetical protein
MAYGFQNLGQPQTFHGHTWTVKMARNGLRYYSEDILNTELLCF